MGSAVAAGYPDSYYTATARGIESAPTLAGRRRVDVCVVGGGYTGLSTALHLGQNGLDVALVEARRVGWGASGRNGGQIGSGQRLEQSRIESRFGPERARELWQLAEQAKALVRSLIDAHGIDCDLQTGQIVAAAKPGHAGELRARADYLERVFDYRQMHFLDGPALRDRLASGAFHGGLLDRGALHLHPLNFALGLARACRETGVRIYEHSPVIEISRTKPANVRTRSAEIVADRVVLACNAYLDRLEPRLAGYIMPINNFMVATEPLQDPQALIRGRICVHDTRFVVNYFRMSDDGRLLFGGGETYRRRFPENVAEFVRPVMTRIFPQLAGVRLDYAWGGTLAITLNRLPQLGRLKPDLWYAHGYSGHGISIGTLAGRLIAEALTGDRRGFDTLASLPARRFPGGTLLRWPAMVAGMLYYSLRDRL